MGYSRSVSAALRNQQRERYRAAMRKKPRGRPAPMVAVILVATALLLTSLTYIQQSGSTAETNSRDGSFTAPSLVNDNLIGTQSAPCVIEGLDGEVFVAWQDTRSGNDDIYFSGSEDEGLSFRTNKRVDDSVGPSKQVEPSGAMSSNGSIYLVWQDNRRGVLDNDIFLGSSSDGGYVFSRNAKVDDSNSTISWQERPSIAISDDGVMLVAWKDDRTNNISRIRMTASEDGGAHFIPSFEIPTSPSQTSGQTNVAVVANSGKFFIAYLDNVSGQVHPYLTVTDTSLSSFSTPVRLDSTGTPGSAQRAVSIAPHPNRGIVAAWEDYRNGNWNIYGAIVSSSGVVEGPNFRVDDSTSGLDQRDPAAATDSAGNLYVVWEDTTSSGSVLRFTYAVAGQSYFHASVIISTPASDTMQRKAAICVLRPGTVVAAWQDDSGGTYDILASRGYVAELDPGIPEFSDLLIPVVLLLVVVIVISRRNRHNGHS